MPLVKEGRLTALMAIHDRVPRRWTDQELSLLREVTARSWAHVERVAATAELRASEGRFRAAVDAVQGVLWTNNAAGKMEGEQPAWAELTGQTFDDYRGYGWSAAVHPDDAEPTVTAWNAAVANKQTFSFEHRLRTRDGEWRRFSVRAIPIFDAAGEIREWVGVHTDVTEQRNAEAALHESEKMLRALNVTLERRVAEALAERGLLADIIDGTDIFVQVVDCDYNWLAINASAASEFSRIFGVPRPRAGDNMLEALKARPSDCAAVKQVWSRALGGEEFVEVDEFGDPSIDRRYYEMRFPSASRRRRQGARRLSVCIRRDRAAPRAEPAQGSRGSAPPEPEDGGDGPAYRRGRSRLQQPSGSNHRQPRHAGPARCRQRP
jgi:PAS domain S-box-containing protein